MNEQESKLVAELFKACEDARDTIDIMAFEGGFHDDWSLETEKQLQAVIAKVKRII